MPDPKIEHLEDFTAHEWCNALLSDPSITRIHKRHVLGNGDEWNSLFTRSLFTDGAIRAFLNLYKPGKGETRALDGKNILTGKSPIFEEFVPSDYDKEVRRQAAKEDVQHDLEDSEAPENTLLVSLGRDLEGGVGRLHGGVIASLLDQSMGALLIHYYENKNVTTELRVKYKKVVAPPCILKARVRVSREVGRWIELVGWVEDGEGTVYAEGWAIFVLAKIGPPAKM